VESALAEKLREGLPVEGFRHSWSRSIVTGESYESTEDRRFQAIKVGTGESLTHEIGDKFKVPVFVFVGPDVKLRSVKPVSVSVSRGASLWFAENERLDIYVTGETANKAIDEFVQHVVDFYIHYKGLDTAEAARGARELKRLFGEGFTEVSG